MRYSSAILLASFALTNVLAQDFVGTVQGDSDVNLSIQTSFERSGGNVDFIQNPAAEKQSEIQRLSKLRFIRTLNKKSQEGDLAAAVRLENVDVVSKARGKPPKGGSNPTIPGK